MSLIILISVSFVADSFEGLYNWWLGPEIEHMLLSQCERVTNLKHYDGVAADDLP